MDQEDLPKWIKKGQAIGQALTPGLVFVLPCLLIPHVKSVLDINIKLGSGYLNLYSLISILLILIAIPCFIFHAPKIDITKFFNK